MLMKAVLSRQSRGRKQQRDTPRTSNQSDNEDQTSSCKGKTSSSRQSSGRKQKRDTPRTSNQSDNEDQTSSSKGKTSSSRQSSGRKQKRDTPRTSNQSDNEDQTSSSKGKTSSSRQSSGRTGPSSDGVEEIPYEWLPHHPWQDYQASDGLEKDFDNLISCSNNYPLSKTWITNDKVDLRKVYNKRHIFIQENDEFIYKKSDNTIKQKKFRKEEKYTAQSLSSSSSLSYRDSKSLNHLIDVDGYMLKVSIPQQKKQFLEKSGFASNASPNLSRRWVFVPSYMRANCGLFDWSQAGVDEETTIRIVVVRPSEFKEYVKHVGNDLPIISLPDNKIGIGYARYWILKIATSLGLEYIWMIDDDVKQFYEFHPGHTPEDKMYGERRRRFNEVFTKFEGIVKENERDKLAAISPVSYNGKRKHASKTAFRRKPPRVAVFLNLKLINQQGVRYRPQLVRFEDMLFAKECEENNLKVLMWHRIQTYSMPWRRTGCHSAAVDGRRGRGVRSQYRTRTGRILKPSRRYMEWMSEVVEVHPRKDGLVRTATIKTQRAQYRTRTGRILKPSRRYTEWMSEKVVEVHPRKDGLVRTASSPKKQQKKDFSPNSGETSCAEQCWRTKKISVVPPSGGQSGEDVRAQYRTRTGRVLRPPRRYEF